MPRVVRRSTGWGLRVAATATETAIAAGAAALSLRTVHLGGGVAERRTDLVDLHFGNGALLAVGLPRPRHQAARHDDAHALRQRLGHVLRGLAPQGAAHEQRLAVLPLVRLTVERARSGRHREVHHGRTGLDESQFGVAREVANHGDLSVACHVSSLSVVG